MFTLHAHSFYSLLQGTIPVDDLISFAKQSGSSYVALTDTNAMYGLIQFAKAAREMNIKPILGALIDDPSDKTINAVFLAKNIEGYSLLCRIITARKLKENFSLIDIFSRQLDDLFIITSSIELLNQIQSGTSLRKNLFVELIITGKHKKKTRELFEYAKEKGLQIVASHPAYFMSRKDYLLHKVVSAIRLNATLDNIPGEELVDEEFYLKTPDELKKDWRSLPEAVWNAERIAQSCNVDLQLGNLKFPAFALQNEETAFSYLWKISFNGLGERYKPITEQAVKRLQYELEVIDELGYSDYFLVVWDIVREAKQRGMMHIGRGSAANSLVSFCLGFTEVDPIKHNLYFERFLNRGRLSPPDVDLDFSWKERDEIIKYVFEKYGFDKVAMISTTVTFRARSAFREVAKTFGIAETEITKFSKFIPWTSAKNLLEISEKFPETKSLDFKSEPWKSIIEIASRLSSFPRHLSIHPSGIIITNNPITDYVALEYAKNKGIGIIITQPDMYPIEDLGLVKIDLLSQRSLGVIKDVMNEINNNFRTTLKTTNQPAVNNNIFNLEKPV